MNPPKREETPLTNHWILFGTTNHIAIARVVTPGRQTFRTACGATPHRNAMGWAPSVTTRPPSRVCRACQERLAAQPLLPFLKWAGSKRDIAEVLAARAPAEFGRYFEPFVGAGALFFHMRPRRATLGDDNPHLMRTYAAIQNNVEGVIRLLKGYPIYEQFYYELRDTDVSKRSDEECAAWLIYMNKTGYNGLFRVNQDGKYNVPWGRRKNPRTLNADRLRAASEALQRVTLKPGPFTNTLRGARRGDFAYFDPPYDEAFDKYTVAGFDDNAQKRLRDTALKLKRRGVHIMVSNADTPFIRALYAKHFTISPITNAQQISRDTRSRGTVQELVIT